MTFDLKDEQEVGPSYWKMNSSVLKDNLYKTEVENAIKGINDLQLSNPIDWWDLFIMVVQGVTISYTKRKSKIENGLKRVIINQIHRLENINSDNMTTQQKKKTKHTTSKDIKKLLNMKYRDTKLGREDCRRMR